MRIGGREIKDDDVVMIVDESLREFISSPSDQQLKSMLKMLYELRESTKMNPSDGSNFENMMECVVTVGTNLLSGLIRYEIDRRKVEAAENN